MSNETKERTTNDATKPEATRDLEGHELARVIGGEGRLAGNNLENADERKANSGPDVPVSINRNIDVLFLG